MNIYLNRYLQNRTYTQGKLQIQGFTDVFDTLERDIPRDKTSYVKHCLPPGQYNLIPELSLLSIQSLTVRKPWFALQRVKWFPKAGIFTNFEGSSMQSGRIFVGLGTPDEWSITQNDIVTAKIINALQTIYDAKTGHFTDTITLHITESPDIIVHDYDYNQYLREQQAAQELQSRLEAEQRLQRLLTPCAQAPTSPNHDQQN